MNATERTPFTAPYTPDEIEAIARADVLRRDHLPYTWSAEGRMKILEKIARAYARLVREMSTERSV